MLQAVRSAFLLPDLRKKILITFLILGIYRLAAHVPVPGVNTAALDQEQRERVLQNLSDRLTSDGDIIIHSSSSRSQQQNKEMGLSRLAIEIRKALYVPKKRVQTKISKNIKEARLKSKKVRSEIKKLRSKPFMD